MAKIHRFLDRAVLVAGAAVIGITLFTGAAAWYDARLVDCLNSTPTDSGIVRCYDAAPIWYVHPCDQKTSRDYLAC